MRRHFLLIFVVTCMPLQAMEVTLGCAQGAKIAVFSTAGLGAMGAGLYWAVYLPSCNGYNGWDEVFCHTNGTETDCGNVLTQNRTLSTCIRTDQDVGWTRQRILQSTMGPMISVLGLFSSILPKTLCDVVRPTDEYARKSAAMVGLQGLFASYAFFCADSVSAIVHGATVLMHVGAFITLRHKTLADIIEPQEVIP